MHLRTASLLAAAGASLTGAESHHARQATAPTGTEAWAAAHSKAAAALSKLSQNDKVNIVTGVGWDKGPCVGNTARINAINYPQLCLQDGPLGIRFGTGVNAFTPGIQAGSTWDVELIRQRGQYIAAEAKGCGVHVLLGPAPGALGKIPNAGRNWEGFGADPYLQGVAAAVTIEAIQSQGVQAAVKHYIANEQERNRETMSSNVDDRTLHELYLWPFADSVHANVASVMCSYNKVNGTWACENDKIMNGILKTELGFPGYVVSDWNAQHSTNAAAINGLDMTMPGSDFNGRNVLWGSALNQAVSSNQVPKARLDDMVKRILAAWYLLKQDSSYPGINLKANVQSNHKENIRAVARDGIVLLKNSGILPLSKPKKIALIGSAAVVNPKGRNACVDRGCNDGALGMGWGSGTVEYPYFVAPYDAINERARSDGTTVSLQSSDSTSGVSNVVSGADVAIVIITANSGEGYITVQGAAGDRQNLDPWHNGNQLVQAVAQASQNVIVVVHSTGPIVLETIQALPNVKAIVWAGLPSQENGNALVDILYGVVSPNGKLPYTIGKSQSDYGTSVVTGNDDFREGLYVDYRHFDSKNIAPRYEFGFGLSYTNFTYSDITIDSTAKSGAATGKTIPGGREDLFEAIATVTASITNSGGVEGAEVAQLYISLPSSAPAAPPKQLRGFDKIKLKPGAKGTVTFNLRRKDLSYWDVRVQNWVVPAGSFGVSVGASSRDIRLTGTIAAA
ncbi:glycosyl hydrolase family 3 N terminal domain-containing protein [Cercophora newfieldiana]|uniref:Beta-glucosidase cel3A n=1 Tax=Cercophora newfieldiana TaxID=92897 RepID=A0AA39XYG2_9PEZI|nr:glycosyl hydrolase family 3 N terminal domain-containing protein [Cercophora newfieldiana]